MNIALTDYIFEPFREPCSRITRHHHVGDTWNNEQELLSRRMPEQGISAQPLYCLLHAGIAKMRLTRMQRAFVDC